jgi:D-alanyl-D-alanine carboxypeptidase
MAAGGMAADAASVARWGYQLYGGRVVQPAIVTAMTGGDSEYGLGTMRFSLSLGLGDAYGHIGMAPGYTSMLAVVPEKRLAAAIRLADGHRNANTVMSRLFQAIQEIS